MTPGFAEDGGEITAAKAESPLNGAGHCNFGFAAGHSKLLAVNPHPSGAVVDFECSHAHHVEGIHHPAGYCDLVIVEARRIAVDRLNAAARRASSQHKGRGNNAGYGDRS